LNKPYQRAEGAGASTKESLSQPSRLAFVEPRSMSISREHSRKCQTSSVTPAEPGITKPTKWVIDQPPMVRITGRSRPDCGTIGRSGADRDYQMSRHDPHFGTSMPSGASTLSKPYKFSRAACAWGQPKKQLADSSRAFRQNKFSAQSRGQWRRAPEGCRPSNPKAFPTRWKSGCGRR
jgi:hypothetical protein